MKAAADFAQSLPPYGQSVRADIDALVIVKMRWLAERIAALEEAATGSKSGRAR